LESLEGDLDGDLDLVVLSMGRLSQLNRSYMYFSIFSILGIKSVLLFLVKAVIALVAQFLLQSPLALFPESFFRLLLALVNLDLSLDLEVDEIPSTGSGDIRSYEVEVGVASWTFIVFPSIFVFLLYNLSCLPNRFESALLNFAEVYELPREPKLP